VAAAVAVFAGVAASVEVDMGPALAGVVTGSADKGASVMPGSGVIVAVNVGTAGDIAGCVGVAVSWDEAIQLMVAIGSEAASPATRYRS
jgi:hypothetical protein